MSLLAPHGNFTIKWQGNILLLYASGNFNLEGVRLVNQPLKKCISEKGVSQWARIDVLTEDVLGGPEVLSEVEVGIQWCKANGCAEVIGIVEGVKAALFKRFLPGMVLVPTLEEALNYLSDKEINQD